MRGLQARSPLSRFLPVLFWIGVALGVIGGVISGAPRAQPVPASQGAGDCLSGTWVAYGGTFQSFYERGMTHRGRYLYLQLRERDGQQRFVLLADADWQGRGAGEAPGLQLIKDDEIVLRYLDLSPLLSQAADSPARR